MKEFIEKLIGRLEEKAIEHRETGFEMERKGFSNIADKQYAKQTTYLNAIEIVNQLAEEYMACYKSCTDCEAYDREKHHCPKFCYIIAETVKEIEENHNGWIPCSERLPETDDDVLCWYEYFRYGEYNRMYQTYGIGHYFKSLDAWGGEVSNGHKCRVIAWQPLPQAYQPKGE